MLEIVDEKLVLMAQSGDKVAESELLNKHKRTVINIAKKYYMLGSDYDDVIQEGMIGLFKAIRDFKISERGNSFFNFANMCIRRQILSGVSTANRLKHSPLNNAIFLEDDSFLEDAKTPEKIQLNKETVLDFNDTKSRLLTKYEKRVLELFIDGKKYKEIAAVVRRDEKSVNNAMQRIRKKFKVNN